MTATLTSKASLSVASHGSNNTSSSLPPVLSKKATNGLSKISPLLLRLMDLFENCYSHDNPNGIINFGVAENSLMTKEMVEFYESNFHLDPLDLTYGTGLFGSKRIFDALCHFVTKYFNPVTPLKHEHIITGAGCSAIIDQLSEMICDEGESILIAKPYYNGFDADVSARVSAQMIGVDVLDTIHDPSSPEAVKLFAQKYKQVLDVKGPTPRGILLCNPNNVTSFLVHMTDWYTYCINIHCLLKPLGFCYPRETLIEYCRFAEKYNLHLIVDEIYALSVFENNEVSNTRPFVSILSIDTLREANCDPSRVHVVYGMSKDFCSNGFRIGALISQHNPTLMKAFMRSAILMKISSPADALWSKILTDDKYLSWYIDELRTRMSDAVHYVQARLKEMNIPYISSYAGHFMMSEFQQLTRGVLNLFALANCPTEVDLSEYLPRYNANGQAIESFVDQEIALASTIVEENLYIAPGLSYHFNKPGWFRMTFVVERTALDLGFERLERAIKKISSLSVNGKSINGVEHEETPTTK